MSKQITRRRLLASAGGLAGLALGGRTGAVPGRAARSTADELPVRWNRTYAPNRYNSAVAALERDGQYVAIGATGDQATRLSGWLFAVDGTTGRGQWQTPIENPDLDRQPSFQRLVAAPDGDGFALLGLRLVEGTASLVRTGPEGEVRWWTGYGVETSGDASGTLFSSSLVPVDDGYLVGGYRVVEQTAGAVVVDVAPDGTERSRTRLFEGEQSTLLDAVPDGEGGLVGVGQLQERSTSAADRPQVRAVVFRLNGDLSVQWQQEFTAPTDGDPFRTNRLGAITPTENGYATVGSAVPEGGSSASGWVLLVDGSGTSRASRLFEPRSVTLLNGVVETDDGLAVTGQVAESANSESAAGWIAEVGPEARGRWSKTLGPAAVNNLRDPLATSDGGVAAVGVTQAESRNADPRTQGWLVKLGGEPASSVTSTASESTPTPSPTATASPSPTATPSPTPTLTPTTPPAELASDTPTDADATSGSGPGFGVPGMLAALGVGGLYRRVSREE